MRTVELVYLILVRLLILMLFIFFSFQNGKAQDWTKSEQYFPVYTFSEKVMGLTMEVNLWGSSENDFIDSVYNQLVETNSIGNVISGRVSSCIPIDTTRRFKFYRHLNFETKLLNNIDRSFFVHCTKGVVERKIKDVVFALDECQSNVVVFRFNKIDPAKYCQPIFCSKAQLNLTFSHLPLIDKEIALFKKSEHYDYADSVKAVSFAQADSLYFTYNDDFNWNSESDIKNYYPGRDVYVKRSDKKFYRRWGSGLDLFGIPCD